EGQIALANPRVESLLGLAPHMIIDVPVVGLLADPLLGLAERLGFRPEALQGLIDELAEGRWVDSSQAEGRVTYEIAVPKQRVLERTQAPVRDASGRVMGVLMVFSDITEEHELTQAREDLSSMIVHDLRGPLTAITTSLKLLGEIASPDDPLGKAVRQTTDTSSRAVRKLLSLVDSLLDISKMESGIITLDRIPTALPPICASVVDELFPLAQELDVDLLVDVPDELPLLDIDPEKTERILLNLVDNAIKFTPSYERVVIRGYMPGTAGTPEGFLRIEVQDAGPGIPDEYKERLFDRYTQLEGQRGRRRGTGLGLTFCRLAVEAHGGRIWVEDNPQGGTVFAVTLPVATPD
ncbi:MAG: PAS domain-containing protein, partial [Anaerolineae bacterium]|nr:PAS domain-containing protein [Anaerolineae bacterium]